MKNSKERYVLINLTDFKVRLCKTKLLVAATVNVHRNTLIVMEQRTVYNNWLIVIVNEE
jgi:DNA-binding XRE family transcriptional regulator